MLLRCITSGNVAWAHVRAKDTLATAQANIGGLPVFITDDTPIEDTTRFCQRISRAVSKTPTATTNNNNNTTAAATPPPRDSALLKLRPTWWSIPSAFTYFLALLLEWLMCWCIFPLLGSRLSFPPRALVAYAGSIILFSRLRASIHLDYEPIFNEEKSILNSAKWYEEWYRQYISGGRRQSTAAATTSSEAKAK